METKIAIIKKILQEKYKFGPLTARNLVEGNMDIVELEISEEEIAGDLNEIYEQEDEDDE